MSTWLQRRDVFSMTVPWSLRKYLVKSNRSIRANIYHCVSNKSKMGELEKKHGKKFREALKTADLPSLECRAALQERARERYGSCCARLDLLQHDKNMYAGYLIPTMWSLKRKLIAYRSGEDRQPLKYCGDLGNALLGAIRKPGRLETKSRMKIFL